MQNYKTRLAAAVATISMLLGADNAMGSAPVPETTKNS